MYHIASFCFTVNESVNDELDRLALQVYDGNRKAFDKIDEYLRPQIIRMSHKYMNLYHDREDIEQDMMEMALILCYRYDWRLGRYRNYALRSIRFEMFNRIREFKKVRSIEYIKKDKGITFDSGDHPDLGTANPLDAVVKEEQMEYLMSRGVCSRMELKILGLLEHGWTIDAISDELAISRKSVTNSLYRVIRKKELLQEREEAGESFDNMG